MKNRMQNAMKTMMVTTLAMATLIAAGCIGTESIESAAEIPVTPVSEKSGGDDATVDDTVSVEIPALETFDVPAPEPTADKVVTIGSGLKPGSTTAGSVVTYAVRVRTMKPWHIYAINKPTGVSVPTKLKLKLPEGVTAVGEWNIPDPKKYEEDTFIYEEDVVFRCQLKIADNVTGLLDIGCEVKYQPCNDQSCKAPTSTTTKMALEVAAP